MLVVETVAAFRAARKPLGVLGLVPTMGFLHAGHLALVEQARAENQTVAVSIFVNPTQFGPTEDLARYPRDLPRDLHMLEAAGANLVFVPAVEQMYPADFSTSVDVAGVTGVLEGAVRPGHFRGVATVVCKLFNIVDAERAYFGQKDVQQTVVIRRMVRDLNLRTEIVVVPTVREPDGLALSSRNTYLDPEQRAAAPVLFGALEAARGRWEAGEQSAAALHKVIHAALAHEPLARVDYVSIADPETLAELDQATQGAVISLAVRVGKTRLIDNVILRPPDEKREATAERQPAR